MLRPILIVLMLILVGCAGNDAPPTPTPTDPLALIAEAAANIRAAETFRIDVSQTGPDYTILTEYAPVYFRRASAQYVAPGMMQATVRVIAAGLPLDVDVFASGAAQWYRAIWTGNNWINEAFAPGFNPETLIASETGFQAALNALTDLDYAGEETLESGAPVHHIAARAQGEEVNALLAGLIETRGEVDVHVYIHRETRMPVRFVITEYDSPYAVTPEAGEEAEPVVWIIDLYDINAPAELSTPEVTAEATAEATDEITGFTPSFGLFGS